MKAGLHPTASRASFLRSGQSSFPSPTLRPSNSLRQCATSPAAAPPAEQREDEYGLENTPSTSGRPLGPSQYVRVKPRTYSAPSITDTGTLRPAAEWFPVWMRYRRREDNYVFWQDKFNRNSLDIPYIERRWTLFSTFWYLVVQTRFYAFPPALRFFVYLGWRQVMTQVYEMHKAVVLWQSKCDAYLASKATGGSVSTFSRTMALRRLHWQNSIMGEAMYLMNVWKTGRVHMLPPKKAPMERPTFFFLF